MKRLIFTTNSKDSVKTIKILFDSGKYKLHVSTDSLTNNRESDDNREFNNIEELMIFINALLLPMGKITIKMISDKINKYIKKIDDIKINIKKLFIVDKKIRSSIIENKLIDTDRHKYIIEKISIEDHNKLLNQMVETPFKLLN